MSLIFRSPRFTFLAFVSRLCVGWNPLMVGTSYYVGVSGGVRRLCGVPFVALFRSPAVDSCFSREWKTEEFRCRQKMNLGV